jgi:hypothetical protein
MGSLSLTHSQHPLLFASLILGDTPRKSWTPPTPSNTSEYGIAKVTGFLLLLSGPNKIRKQNRAAHLPPIPQSGRTFLNQRWNGLKSRRVDKHIRRQNHTDLRTVICHNSGELSHALNALTGLSRSGKCNSCSGNVTGIHKSLRLINTCKYNLEERGSGHFVH